MKQLLKIVLMVVMLQVACKVSAQWVPQTSGAANSILTDVVFLNKDTGFVTGGEVMLKTVNGGTTWTPKATQLGLEGLFFTDKNTGFAVGLSGKTGNAVMYKTVDAGTNWSEINFPFHGYFHDVFFLSPTTGFIVGDHGCIFKTVNGGNTWDSIPSGTRSILMSVSFTDSLHGLAVGGTFTNSIILKTANGGSSWTTVPIQDTTGFLQSIHFPSPLIGYIVGWKGEIFKTTDGGDHWNKQQAVSNDGNLDVFFVDDTTGYVVGGNSAFSGIQKTIDGGLTWVAQSSGVNMPFTAVCFINRETGFIVGDHGTIIKTINGGSTGISGPVNPAKKHVVYPNPFTESITIHLGDIEYKSASVKVYDLIGQVVYESKFIESAIDLSVLKSGRYVLVIQQDGETAVEKITKL
ncbi:MAG: YCF48-related protein [Bacteroidota bacterium]